MGDKTPRYHQGIDLDLLAWDISDAIAKSVDPEILDVSMDEITPLLPAFIDALRATQGSEATR